MTGEPADLLPCYGVVGRRGIVFWHKVGSHAGIGRATAERLLSDVGEDIDRLEARLLEAVRGSVVARP